MVVQSNYYTERRFFNGILQKQCSLGAIELIFP